MPLVEESTYSPPPFFNNGHIQTIIPSLLRIVTDVNYKRERIHTPDHDFLDLDWSKLGSKNLAIVIHGLESNSEANYMKAMIKALNRRNWDAVAINLRGCSGEPNKLFRSYHCGETEDIQTVFSHITQNNSYNKIALVGFSLGGNIILKYVGEQGKKISPLIHKAAAVSVPCDLESSAWHLAKNSRWLYMKRFIFVMQKKFRLKHRMFPEKLDQKYLHSLKTFKDIDEWYTAPAHGFTCAEEYWSKASSINFVSNINIPTLLINAQDDPLLSQESFPWEEAKKSQYFIFEAPRSGGHVGFITFNKNGEYWHESRISDFLCGRY